MILVCRILNFGISFMILNQQKIYRFQFSAENTNNEELTRFCISCHIGTVLIFDIVFDKEKQIMNTLLKRILTGVNFLPSYVVIILVILLLESYIIFQRVKNDVRSL